MALDADSDLAFHPRRPHRGNIGSTLTEIAKRYFQSEHVEPFDFWLAGLRFFEWSDRPDFIRQLISRLAAWQRSGRKRIVAEESFRLSRPGETVPRITEVLEAAADDRVFLAGLLLAASEAVDSQLGSTYVDRLKAIANGGNVMN